MVDWGIQLIKKAINKKWEWTGVGGVVVVLSALFLRLFNLNLIPVFADEAIYIRWAQVMRAETTLRFLPLTDGKQPLFMWVTMPFLKYISDPLVAGRVVSVFSGLGTIVGIFFLSYLLFKSRKVSLFATLLYALSPFAVFFDRMALVDSMLSMFGVWTLALMILAIRHQRLDASLLAGFALGGAMLTKSPALFFVLLSPSVLIFMPFKKKTERVVNLVKSIGLLAVTCVLGFAIYNILRLGPNFHLIAIRNMDYVFPYNHILTEPNNPLVGNMERVFAWILSMGPGSLLVLAIVGGIINLPKRWREIAILLVWGLLPVLIEAEYSKAFTARYILFTFPPLVILAASILKRFKKAPKVYVTYALASIFFVQTFVFHSVFFNEPHNSSWPEKDGYLADWTAGTGIKEASQIIISEREANPELQIVLGTEGYFGTLPNGAEMYLQGETGIRVIGVGLDLEDVPDSLLESVASGNITYLMVNSSRLDFSNFSEKGLEVIASYDKAPRTPGTHGYVSDGPQDTFYLFEITKDAL